MKNIFKLSFLSFVAVTILSLVASCTCKDIDWDPHSDANPRIQGLITTNGGKVLPGSTITLVSESGKEYEVVSGDSGKYYIGDIIAGTYSIKAVGPDSSYGQKLGEVVLQNNMVTVWDAILIRPNTEFDLVKDGEGATMTISAPNVVEIDTAKTVLGVYRFEHGSVQDDDYEDLQLSSDVYIDYSGTNSSSAKSVASRAKGDVTDDGFVDTGDDVDIKFTITSNSGKTETVKAFRITCTEFGAPDSILHNGVKIPDSEIHQDAEGHYYFETNKLGDTRFVYSIYRKDGTPQEQAITFLPNTFSGYATQISAMYAWTSGVQIIWSNQYIDQYIALKEGAVKATTQVGTLNLDVNIPAGESLVLSGYQYLIPYKYRCGEQIGEVIKYSNIHYSTGDREHTGGSSN